MQNDQKQPDNEQITSCASYKMKLNKQSLKYRFIFIYLYILFADSTGQQNCKLNSFSEGGRGGGS